MCTITAHRRIDGWLVTMNRDERRDRGASIAPHHWESPKILAPQDPNAHGTWIGVRPDGIWACLLNGYLDNADVMAMNTPQTRGRLIPNLLASEQPTEYLQTLQLNNTHAFKMWVGTNNGISEFCWNQKNLTRSLRPVVEWDFVTSTSLEKEKITALRRASFKSWVDNGMKLEANGLPNLHIDPMGLPATHAIPMAREKSHTKSITQISIENNIIRMQQWNDRGWNDPSTDSITFHKNDN